MLLKVNMLSSKKHFILTYLFLLFSVIFFAQTEFITTWQTTSAGESITIPTTGSGYNYNVNWGDGSLDDVGVTGSIGHVYATANTYTVTITGTFNRIYFNNAGDKDKILSIEQWGSGRLWTSMSDAFEGCTNIVNNAIDTPDLTNTTSLQRMFRNATAIGSGSATNWNLWDVSSIINMRELFFGTSFNNDISGWVVSNVNNFNGMFRDNSAFNQNISGWITTSATNMGNMFFNATNFNQNIGGWITDNVNNMSSMFRFAINFNQNLNSWNVSNVTNMNSMFRNSTAFNGDISSWNTVTVINMSNMFREASNFNQNIGGWNTTSVNYMNSMFYNASSFNQNIGGWNTSAVTTMARMFQNAINFNQNIGGWTVTSVNNMDRMFSDASSFNQDLNSWNVANVTNMTQMFRNATNFNGNINSWTPLLVTNMSGMFQNATNFNQNISGWTTTSLTNMNNMFRNATSFNQNIGGWDVSGVTTMNSIFNGVTLSPINYNALLVGWESQTLQTGISFNANNSKYCATAAIAAKANIIATYGWSFNDDGEIASFTWTGATDTAWNTSSNWLEGYAPECILDVTIPVVTNYPIINSASEIDVANLTINSGASLIINGALTVNGDLTTNDGLSIHSGGSIIVTGASSGELTYTRNIANGAAYYNTSPPVIGETIEDFIANNSLNTGSGNVGLYYYNNDNLGGFAGTSYYFYQPSSTGSFIEGKGYGVQLSSTGSISFTGTMPTTDQSIPITVGAIDAFNLIGNPFPSYLPANTNANINNLLSNNTAILSEETLWLWDNTIQDFLVVNNVSASRYIAPGQGFFVNASGSGAFNFLESWQEHQATDVFTKATNSKNLFSINLFINNLEGITKKTEIYYYPNKTINFDNGFDSSQLFTDTTFSIYTKLLDKKNHKNLAIQTLPASNIESYVIPIGLSANKKIQLKALFKNKPKGLQYYLEDSALNTFTKLNENTPITIDLSAGYTGTNRFFLHATTASLSIKNQINAGIKIYTSKNKKLHIIKHTAFNGNLKIYSILGQKVVELVINSSEKSKEIVLSSLKSGLYILQLKTDKKTYVEKIFLD